MTRLFILLYAGVLTVLFLAWYIHGSVLRRRAEADRARVFEEAHAGGARLVVAELNAAPRGTREQALQKLREQFDYPVDVVSVSGLPKSLRRQIASANEVKYFHPEGEREVVIAALSGAKEAVRLGPFPNYRGREIEEAIGGWLRLAANKLCAAAPAEQDAVLRDLQEKFEFPIGVAQANALPAWEQQRIASGASTVFYEHQPDRWFAATPLPGRVEILRCGPFPSFERIEQKAATTTVALVLLPAALAIALLLRPVANQLRQVEDAAKSIASGDLSARVDERRMQSARPLAQAFNHMASHTESLVRTQRELLQAVSHELRTPLSRMRFAIELIETAKDDAERKTKLEALDAATEELDELVGELLSYVRMETTEQPLNEEEIVLQDTLNVVVPKHAALHPATEFETTDRAASCESTLFADRRGLQRALGNLLSNAGRFAKHRVTIDVQFTPDATVIDVDDDGGGIPISERERVFEPFVRLHDETDGHGAGLGLALVKRIVNRHGGSVEASTSPCGGCRIRTTWPNRGALSHAAS